MPTAFGSRLPKLKLAVAEPRGVVRASLSGNAGPASPRPRSRLHAASFIPQRYLALDAGLFRRRVEVGRILYHELCHFLWPRLGNPKRQAFAALLLREFREKARGELGYSSQWRKEKLPATGSPLSPAAFGRRWREYVCESFCDTGSFVLLGRERRARHSEYTLSRAARERRARFWAKIVLGEPSG